MKLKIGMVLVDKKDDEIIAQIVEEYKFFYLVEVHARSGNYKETFRKDDFERNETRWRV